VCVCVYMHVCVPMFVRLCMYVYTYICARECVCVGQHMLLLRRPAR